MELLSISYIMCPCCGFSSCPQVTIELYNKLHKSLQAATTTRQQYGDNSCLICQIIWVFYPSLCNIRVQAEYGQRAEVIGQ